MYEKQTYCPGVTFCRGDNDGLWFTFEPEATKKFMHETLKHAEATIEPGCFGWVSNNTDDSRNSGTYIPFWIKGDLLEDLEGNVVVPDDNPILPNDPFGWNPRAHAKDEVGGYYEGKRRDDIYFRR